MWGITSQAYIFVTLILTLFVVTFVVVSHSRLRKISALIKTIPEADRVGLLAKEYNVLPRNGLSAEQYLTARRSTLRFAAYVSSVGAVTLVIIIGLQSPPLEAVLTKHWEKQLLDQKARLVSGEPLSNDDLRFISLSLQALADKLSAPAIATKAYAAATSDARSALQDGRVTLPRLESERLDRALQSHSPSLARSTLRDVAEASLSNSAEAFYQVGRLAEADGDLREAELGYKKALQLKSEEAKYLEAYQAICLHLGRFSESLDVLQRLQSLLTSSGKIDEARARNLEFSRAGLLLRIGRLPEAAKILLALKSAAEAQNDFSRRLYGQILNDLASTYHNWGLYREAESLVDKAIEIFLSDPKSIDLASALNNRAFLHIRMHKTQTSASDLNQSLRILSDRLGTDYYNLIPVFNNLARLRAGLSDYSGAEAYLVESDRLSTLNFGGTHPLHARTLDVRSEISLKRNALDSLCVFSEASLALKRVFYPDQGLEMAYSLQFRAYCLLGKGEIKEGEEQAKLSLSFFEHLLGRNNTRVADAEVVKGLALIRTGATSSAANCLQAALSTRQRLLGLAHPDVLELREQIEALNLPTLDGAAGSCSP